ncbi:MAG: DNA replication/repair protein RecF [Clostridia bacterium]|nr:DNA replication/repair protein RecF [Clostridia bacterium]
MLVSRITFRDWRNIPACTVPLSGGINVLWGMNAQGKSNILEGIYYFARGRSFRSAKERELVRFGCDFASAVLQFRRDGYTGDTTLEAILPAVGKKKLLRNGAPLSSAAEMMGSFRAVLFCPANLSIVTGGPLERRTFLDIAISQLSGAYLTYLRRYTKILTERNALIKRVQSGERVTREEWEVYAESLSECGAWIAAYRSEYASYLREAVARYFSEMTGGAECPGIEYRSHALYDGIPKPLTESGIPDKSVLYEKLVSQVEREAAAGVTLWGVHKDDLILTLNGVEARLFASQGQQRSIVLSLKLAEAEIAGRIGGEYPVILLDDVFSELDENRRRYILEVLGSPEAGEHRQIIVTSCEPDVIPGHQASSVHFVRVSGGNVE